MVALVASVIVLFFRANSQRSTAMAQLREAQHNLAQSQTALTELKGTSDSQSAENAKLRSANQSLAQKISMLEIIRLPDL